MKQLLYMTHESGCFFYRLSKLFWASQRRQWSRKLAMNSSSLGCLVGEITFELKVDLWAVMGSRNVKTPKKRTELECALKLAVDGTILLVYLSVLFSNLQLETTQIPASMNFVNSGFKNLLQFSQRTIDFWNVEICPDSDIYPINLDRFCHECAKITFVAPSGLKLFFNSVYSS